ncbi:hypothetical protein M514_06136 [Trichuris suis]|uniref:Uncharacterized protein n=1 Tax=Trichuris suis TaxID=68888 RepID=A0A085M724_9BILA|nr:hypothetical protein M513_06136 [Trichuris suis]KFD69840.1 hypothetical protein M514_06136 [Trichuris suis]
MEYKLDKANVMDAWKEYSTTDLIIATDKAAKGIKLETLIASWRKTSPDLVHDFVALEAEPIKRSPLNEIMDLAERVEGEGFDDVNVAGIDDLMNSREKELKEEEWPLQGCCKKTRKLS